MTELASDVMGFWSDSALNGGALCPAHQVPAPIHYGEHPTDPQRRSPGRRLAAWFCEHGRNYPWRGSTNPFEVLLAEVMLQRTSPGHVVPIFSKFVETYPTALAIAEAQLTDVEQTLAPLGFRKRAHQIQAMSAALSTEWSGIPPDSYDDLVKLPGVGLYTARAVLCLAYGREVAMPDVNVMRVLSRVTGLISKNRRPQTDRSFVRSLDDLVPEGKAREFNLASIDLGSTICRKRSPRCGECPVADVCLHAKGTRDSV